jgi:hypothetical protein
MFEFFSGATPAGHVAPEARVLIFFCGLVLCTWSLLKLRRRSLLVPTCTLFLTVGSAFILFALFPSLFDRLSYAVGIRYPPGLYLIGCVFVMILMVIHLAFRLSLLDERCRRMAIEIALLSASRGVSRGRE